MQGCCSESLLQVEPWGPAQTLVFSAPPTPVGVVMELSPTHSLSTSPFGCHLCLLGHQGWGGPGDGLWSITKVVLASVLGQGMIGEGCVSQSTGHVPLAARQSVVGGTGENFMLGWVVGEGRRQHQTQ